MDEVEKRIEEKRNKTKRGISRNKRGYTVEEMADIIAARLIMKGGKKLLEERKERGE